jgi:Pyruvate/2-oxoacid:ferredoxin oxidoreductase delta subunit
MSTRTIIVIDEARCTGCGLCVPNCAEGALQIIDGKARLVSDIYCDGLGACLGYCPEGALSTVQREAEPFDEGKAAGKAAAHGSAKPEAVSVAIATSPRDSAGASTLANWPIQLHLLSPMAPTLKGADILLSADCVAHAVPSFQDRLLRGRSLAIACPKLDDGKDVYKEKLIALIDHAQIASLTVAMMEVPCCRGLLALVEQAREQAHRKVPVKAVIVSIDTGEILAEQSL